MSHDLQLTFPCPHVIGEERVVLEPDRRTLYTRQPIGGTGLLRVRLNDTLEVPASTGVQSRALVKSGRREPYVVVPGENVLEVRTASRFFRVVLPTGYLTAARVAASASAILGDVVVATNEGGYVQFRDAQVQGPDSTLRVTGTAQRAMGFDHQSGSRGQQVIPAWTVYSRNVVGAEDGLDGLGYFIRFDSPIRGNPYFSVTYTVAPRFCLRCLGTGIENDFRYDAQGETMMVEDFDLLYQVCLKIILTEVGSNEYHRWYGTTLKQSIGQKATSGASLAMQQSVRTALQNLQDQQNKQAKYQRLTPKERILAVDSVQVFQSKDDPTVFLIDVTVRSFSNEPVNITTIYIAPGTYALSGNQSLLGDGS